MDRILLPDFHPFSALEDVYDTIFRWPAIMIAITIRGIILMSSVELHMTSILVCLRRLLLYQLRNKVAAPTVCGRGRALFCPHRAHPLLRGGEVNAVDVALAFQPFFEFGNLEVPSL